MRVNAGIRRRLATLLGNDVARIKLMNSLLMSMPGSPIIYYGDEIDMGDNIYIGDRNGVRTPMQWSIDRNAGFSRADPQRLYLPLIMNPIYGYQAVNVEPGARSVVTNNWTRQLLAVRRQHKCFGRGTLEFVQPRNRKIFAYLRSYEAQTVLCVANLAQTAQAAELDLLVGRVPVELMGRNSFPPIGELPYFTDASPAQLLLAAAERGSAATRLARGAPAAERAAGAGIATSSKRSPSRPRTRKRQGWCADPRAVRGRFCRSSFRGDWFAQRRARSTAWLWC